MQRLKRNSRAGTVDSVVVATDFSLGAGAALERVARLPLAPRARVAILHVLPFPRSRRASRAVEAFAGSRLEQTVQKWARAAQAAGVLSDLRVSGDLALGRTFLEIIGYARRKRADLVVLGRHGRTRLRDLMIGSTAQRVARHSDVPVLVVNRDPTGPYTRPLFAADLEPGFRHVAEVAARLLDPAAARVSVVHAYSVPFEGWIAVSERGPARADFRRSRREEAARNLKRFVSSLADLGLRCQPRLRHGDPRFVLADEAKRQRSDLLVLGSHGRTGLVRTVMGTVAEAMLSLAPCDVLVARPPGVSVRLP